MNPNPLLSLWNEFLAAVAMLTRIPLPSAGPLPPELQARAMGWLPLVAALMGAAGAVVDGLASLAGIPPMLTAPLAVAAMLWLSGGRDEDGLFRAVRAISQNIPQNQGGDPHALVANAATIALVLVLVVKCAAIASFASSFGVFAGLITAAAWARAVMVATAGWLPAQDMQLPHPPLRRILMAVGLALLLMALLLDTLTVLLAMLAGTVAALLFATLAQQHLGGQTSASRGGITAAAELAVLITLVAVQA